MSQMSYQEARRVHNKSLSYLIAQNMAAGDSIGSSISGAISDKLQSKVKRFKGKFDPLNIARVMTGGSKLGPAILGRLMGRSQEDIDYFARVRKLAGTSRRTVSPLLTTIPSGRIVKIKKGDNAADIITKLYSLIQKSYDEQLKREEIQKSFKNEQKEEDERRHKEIIKALLDIGGIKNQNVPVEKKEDMGIFGFITDLIEKTFNKIIDTINAIFNGITNTINGVIDRITTIFDDVFKLKNLLKVGPSIPTSLVSLLKSNLGIAALGAAIAAAPFLIDPNHYDTEKMIEKSHFTLNKPVSEMSLRERITGQIGPKSASIQELIDGKHVFTQQEADDIKKYYEINVPTEQISKYVKLTTDQQNLIQTGKAKLSDFDKPENANLVEEAPPTPPAPSEKLQKFAIEKFTPESIRNLSSNVAPLTQQNIDLNLTPPSTGSNVVSNVNNMSVGGQSNTQVDTGPIPVRNSDESIRDANNKSTERL